MVFDFTQYWVDGQHGNVYFLISHILSNLLKPLRPLSAVFVDFEKGFENFSSLFQIKDISSGNKKSAIVSHDLNKSCHIGNRLVIIL